MASTTSKDPNPPQDPSPGTNEKQLKSTSTLSNLFSRFRLKHSAKEPSSLPEDVRPPLIPSPLPLVLAEHQHSMPSLGWCVVSFPKQVGGSCSATTPSLSTLGFQLDTDTKAHARSGGEEEAEERRAHSMPRPAPPGAHPLHLALADLFHASQSFFALPAEAKAKWKSKLGSEEGWSHIPGEKEFLTLRTREGTPQMLRPAAERYWRLVGGYLEGCLGRVECALGLEEGALAKYIGRCDTMPGAQDARAASMLRLFRYEGVPDGDAVQVVAEPHADLGLLSLVVGDVAGLEVWDGRGWCGVERGFERGHGHGAVGNATLLVGRQLEWLSNGRYVAGGHRVVSYPREAQEKVVESDEREKPYRYSIVFVLRADEDVVVDTDALTTPVTGVFARPLRGVRAGEWYRGIQRAHFNVNTGRDERDRQRAGIAMRSRG